MIKVRPNGHQLRELKRNNKRRPKKMTLIPIQDWEPSLRARKRDDMIELWHSQRFIAQVFSDKDGAIRVSINRTMMRPDGEWKDKITWDEIQQVKDEIGRGDRYAIEVYPPNADVVNVANMRHIFILARPLIFTIKGV